MNEDSVKLRKRKKAGAREAGRTAGVDTPADASRTAVTDEPALQDDAPLDVAGMPEATPGVREEMAAQERAERAETWYEAAAQRLDVAAERAASAEARYTAAAERLTIADARYRSAMEHAERAEARYTAAAQRLDAAADRAASAEADFKGRAEELDRIAGETGQAGPAGSVLAREKAAAERDLIANARDRAAFERDQLANARERAAAERDQLANPHRPEGRDSTADGADDPVLERARLEAELQHAHLDALTGAFRREMGRLALRNEIDRARRADGSFVIAFIDVDGLKGVNDRDGHAAGDRVLRTLVATMRANLRSYDPIVRFGGDEFICGVGSIDPGEVRHRIGVIDQSLRSATGVGITAGLASLTSNESIDELTAKADEALIEAKRNRGE